ncbi:MAG: ATP-binding cassette domain-containing protein [Oceanospirillales bacterium]|nr:MAG: ATP-binding cassette domain-containing protein [Oceanospirillales bacterium]
MVGKINMRRWQGDLQVQQLCIQRGTLEWQHSFTLKAGQVVVLMGQSGSGKTSLLECLGGFLPAKSGHLVYAGQHIESLPPEQRPVSSLFQQHNLFEHLSVEQNLKLGFQRGKPSSIQWQSVVKACERLGVSALIKRFPSELSGGQRQRVALIRTVLREQPILLLDEPFSALDDETRIIAGDWMKEQLVATGQCAVLVSHQQSDSERLADQILRI